MPYQLLFVGYTCCVRRFSCIIKYRCRTSYCLLGIRVAYEGLENQGYLDAKQTEKVIFNSLIENYHVRPEQVWLSLKLHLIV